jgi:hypothetical protein
MPRRRRSSVSRLTVCRANPDTITAISIDASVIGTS